MTYRFQDIIDMFLNGETNARAGSRTSPGNLGIKGDQLFHYSTPIMERIGNMIVVNLSHYSIETGRVQKMIKMTLTNTRYSIVRGVPRDYKGSLADFTTSEEKGETGDKK